MKKYISVGIVSGASTTIGFLPHIISLCSLLFIENASKLLVPMVIFTIGARLLGEVIFWRFFKDRMDTEMQSKAWRTVIDRALFASPNVIIALVMIMIDATIDLNILYFALKSPIPVVWAFLALLICQALASPIQGFLSDYYSRKKSIIFALVMGFLALMLAKNIFVFIKDPETNAKSFFGVMGLSTIGLTAQMLIVLCWKGLLANLAVIGRGAIAEVIQVESIRKFSNI